MENNDDNQQPAIADEEKSKSQNPENAEVEAEQVDQKHCLPDLNVQAQEN